MNRREFFGEAATSFMACSGLAMLASGSKIRPLPVEPEREWIGSGWVLYAWRIRSKHGNHSWIEFRETVHKDGVYWTRPWDSLGAFEKTEVGKDRWPIGEVKCENGLYHFTIPGELTNSEIVTWW